MSDQTVVKFKKPAATSNEPKKRIPCLIVVEGNNIGETYQLTKPAIIIGRSDKAEVMLSEDGISRQHARIDLHESSHLISDLGSTNGTFVNEEPIKQKALNDGDKIRLGDVVLRFSFQDQVDVDYQEKLRTMAMKDGLTRIFNRRYFMDALQREVSFALRQRQPLTCALLDIDFFKKVNDTYGHAAGDAVLKGVAEKLSNEVRGYDLVARYGGEEFVVLLRSTALDNALIFSERIRKVIETTEIAFESQILKVTISVGVATLDPDKPLAPDDLLKQADRYLYAAKQAGRNRVASARNHP